MKWLLGRLGSYSSAERTLARPAVMWDRLCVLPWKPLGRIDPKRRLPDRADDKSTELQVSRERCSSDVIEAMRHMVD